MTAQHDAAAAAGGEWWRRVPLYLVVVGAMVVSIVGQVASIQDTLGRELAVVLALTNDLGAVIALNYALSALGASISRWAWTAILMAAGTGAALNTWHAIAPRVETGDGQHVLPELPWGFGLLIGVEPILLVLVLTHLAALANAARRQTATAAGDRQPTASPASPTASAATASPAGDRQVATTRIEFASAGDRQDRQPPALARPPAAGPDDRQPAGGKTASPAGDRQAAGDPKALPASTRPPAPRQAAEGPTRALRAVPDRPEWMTQDLIDRVVSAMRDAQRAGKPYGRPRLANDHGLTGHQARTLLDHIAEHNLLQEKTA